MRRWGNAMSDSRIRTGSPGSSTASEWGQRRSLEPLDLESRVCLLQISYQSLERGLLAQGFEIGIHPEEGPAGPAGADAALEPLHRLLRFSQYRMNAGDIVVDMVGVTHGARGGQRALSTEPREVGLTAPRVQHAVKADHEGLVRYLCQRRRHPLLGQLQVPAHEGWDDA